MNLKTRLSVLLLSTPILAFVLVGGLMGNASAENGDERFQHLRVFQDVVSLVTEYYVEPVKIGKVMDGAMRGLAEGLDPDSAYLNEEQVRQLEAGTPLPDGDVGLELTRQFYLRVIASRDGSPAAKAGLQSGDHIRAIDGKATRDMSVFEGARLLRGAPGSKVTLTVIRGNAAEPHEIALVREKPSPALVSGKALAADTGYVRVATFKTGAAAALRKQIADLAKGGANALVLDIRGTAEGTYDEAIAAARLFVKSGTLAVKAGRAKEDVQRITAADPDGEVTMPVVLLVTVGTSGPAEVFAAALRDNKRAELVGEHTIGRAGVQKLVRLPENLGLWLTYARYLTPGDQPIHGKGLDPDLAVEQPDVDFGAPAPATDPILDAARERLSAKKAA
jgi:carboxyl-terminal processing protease